MLNDNELGLVRRSFSRSTLVEIPLAVLTVNQQRNGEPVARASVRGRETPSFKLGSIGIPTITPAGLQSKRPFPERIPS